MGLFLRTCHQICHLSPSARCRQQVNYSSVWPAVPFRCPPPRPDRPLTGGRKPAGAEPPPRRSPGSSFPHGSVSPCALPPGEGRGGLGAAGGAFPEGRGRAATCRRPPRGCAPLGWSAADAWTAAGGVKDPRQQGTKSPPFRCKIRFVFGAAPPTTRAVAGAALAARARHHGGGEHAGTAPQISPAGETPRPTLGSQGKGSPPLQSHRVGKRRGRGGRWCPGESGAMFGSTQAAREEEDNP